MIYSESINNYLRNVSKVITYSELSLGLDGRYDKFNSLCN